MGSDGATLQCGTVSGVMVPHRSTDSVMGSDGATLQCGTVSGVMVPHRSTDSVMGSDVTIK